MIESGSAGHPLLALAKTLAEVPEGDATMLDHTLVTWTIWAMHDRKGWLPILVHTRVIDGCAKQMLSLLTGWRPRLPIKTQTLEFVIQISPTHAEQSCR